MTRVTSTHSSHLFRRCAASLVGIYMLFGERGWMLDI